MVERAATERDRGRLKDRLVEFRKRKMKKMKQGASSKRRNANLIPPRYKVMRHNKSCAMLFGSMSKILTKNEDARKR